MNDNSPLSGEWLVALERAMLIEETKEQDWSVPQIQKDRLGRYQFLPVQTGKKDCCGFVYHIFGRSVKWDA